MIELNDLGEFVLGKKLYLRAATDYMNAGRHEMKLTKGPEGQDWICFSFEG